MLQTRTHSCQVDRHAWRRPGIHPLPRACDQTVAQFGPISISFEDQGLV